MPRRTRNGSGTSRGRSLLLPSGGASVSTIVIHQRRSSQDPRKGRPRILSYGLKDEKGASRMRYKPAVLFGIALFYLSGSAARADHIDWLYSWSRSPEKVYADGSTTSYIALTGESEVPAGGNTDVVAANLSVFSNAPNATPATFTHKPYTLTLTLTDGVSGDVGSLAFTGEFSGKVTTDSSNVSILFTGHNTQSLTLGQNLYTVTMDAYAPPGPPGSSNVGSIGAHATVTVQSLSPPPSLPEPSSILLAVMALPAGVLWKRRRQGSRPHPRRDC